MALWAATLLGMENRIEPTRPAGQSDQVTRAVRTVLPPLLSRYFFRALRLAAITPAGRVVTFWAITLLLIALLGPAAAVGGLVWLAGHNRQQATAAGAVVFLISAAIMITLAAKAYSRWRRWRRAHLY
jgi:hypothetical protein